MGLLVLVLRLVAEVLVLAAAVRVQEGCGPPQLAAVALAAAGWWMGLVGEGWWVRYVALLGSSPTFGSVELV